MFLGELLGAFQCFWVNFLVLFGVLGELFGEFPCLALFLGELFSAFRCF